MAIADGTVIMLVVVNQVTINRQPLQHQQGQQLQNHFLKATVVTDQMDGREKGSFLILLPLLLGGVENPLEDGTPAECDPNSEYWCCSEHGFCGGTQEHCYCETCINYRPINLSGKVRSDRRCGKEFPLDDGSSSECDGNSANHCCSKFGYCGPGPDHCDCVGCTDYRSKSPIEKQLVNGKVRADRRCGGGEFALPDGSPSECDPNSANPCCSQWGYCGPDADHCSCPTCVDYRSQDQKASDFVGKVRSDRRCGNEFPLPDGSGPSECDPNSANHCCSKWGYCGPDADHCDCPECVNYRLLAGSK